MVKHVVQLLIAIMLLWLHIARSQRCHKIIHSKYGKALTKHVYLKINADGLRECIFACAETHVQKCRSTNYDLVTKVCELNNSTYEDHGNDLQDSSTFIYMTSIASASSIVSTPAVVDPSPSKGQAAKSCKSILTSGNSKGDGVYLIDPENTGNPFKVYCDMTTDGGGWILIKNRTLVTPVQSITLSKGTDYRDVSKYNEINVYMDINALKKLKTVTDAKQLRWYCRKNRDGNRAFHVKTDINDAGTKVFEYFTDSTKTFRTACSSFTKLSDDNSIISQNCGSWGKEGSQLRQDKWSWDVYNDMRIFRTVARWENNYAVGMYKDEYFCDDNAGSGVSTVATGDQWLVYIR